MTNKIPVNVLKAIAAKRWAIRPQDLEVIISIANREFSNKEAILASPQEHRNGGRYSVVGNIAKIDVKGVIIPYADMFSEISGATSIEALTESFGECIRDTRIKGIVMNIDSPGGEVTGVSELANLIYNSRTTKPIVAYVSGMACSAALWIASACSKVISFKTSTLGSIGVVACWTDDSEALEREGIKNHEIVSSQTPDKRQDINSASGKAALQKEIDGLAQIFIEDIAMLRGLPVSHVESKFGRGGTMLAYESISVGMSDDTSSLEEVISNLENGGIMSTIVTNQSQTQNPVAVEPEYQTNYLADEHTLAAAEDEEEDEDMEQEDIEVPPPSEDDEKEDEEDALAAEDEDKEEEEDALDAMLKQFSAEKNALKKQSRSLYNSIVMEGVAQERKRIKAIHAMSNRGNSAIILDAMFNSSKSAKDVAYDIVMAGETAKDTALKNLKADKQSLPKIKQSQADQFGTANEKNAIEAIKKGYSKGGKYVNTNIRN